VTTETGSFGAFSARLISEDVGGESIAHWQVADLERHVDRQALLAGDDPAEPPYWAHVWSGARVLARAVPANPGRVIEIGCGLGLPGLTASRRGGRVLFVDWLAEPLRFVRASLATNGLRADVLVADVRAMPVRTRFDLVLAAEILYDRSGFAALAAALAALVAPGGRVLLTDGQRTDTRNFYDALAAQGFRWHASEERLREEGLPVVVRLVEATLASGGLS